MANDLGRQRPDKLKALQALFVKVASVNRVLPIDDRSCERLNAALIGRPDLMAGGTSPTLRSGMNGMGENLFINIKNNSKTIIAEA